MHTHPRPAVRRDGVSSCRILHHPTKAQGETPDSPQRFQKSLPPFPSRPCADTRSAFGAPVSVFLRDGPGSLKRPLRHIPFTEQLRPRPKASVHEGISCGRNLRKLTGRSSYAPLPSSSRDSFVEPHENLHGKVPTSRSFGKRRCLPYGTVSARKTSSSRDSFHYFLPYSRSHFRKSSLKNILRRLRQKAPCGHRAKPSPGFYPRTRETFLRAVRDNPSQTPSAASTCRSSSP